ncbi:MAG: hypothetical protein HOP11_03085 [Saprospiraceae bacterium]|nr:hypothetical protein [Saprospiraceae bacterium]
MKFSTLPVILALSLSIHLSAQGIPPADDCQNGTIYLSPNDLIGTLNPYFTGNLNGPQNICPSGGVANNLGWYSFSSGGGNITISLSITNCVTNGTGLQFAIYKACDFSSPVVCQPNCSGPGTYTFALNMEPCVVYNLVLDGCSGDYCDVQFSYGGNVSPCELEITEEINLDNDKMLESCEAQYKELFIEGGHHNDLVEWSIDNAILPNETEHHIEVFFSNTKTYKICARTYRLGPNGQPFIYSDYKCSTLTVHSTDDVFGADRILCFEQAYPKPYNWNGISIETSGTYNFTHTNLAGCTIDSVVNFIVLDKPTPKENWHIGTNKNDFYVDNKGITHKNCNQIVELGFLSGSGCNEYINIHQYIPNFSAKLEPVCINDRLHFRPVIQNLSCYSVENTTLVFHYFLKDTINKRAPLIQAKENLLIPYKSDFQLLAEVDVYFGTTYKRIKVDLGVENIDESIYLADAGRDIQTYKLDINLNASTTKAGFWRFVSGPGTITFDNVNDPKTRITISNKGTYFVEWVTNYQNCTYTDRLKINAGEFFNDPNKKKVKLTNDEESQIYLIPGGTDIRIKFNEELSASIHYYWLNVFGQVISSGKALHPSDIRSPLFPGFYLLKIQSEEVDHVLKIQVIE